MIEFYSVQAREGGGEKLATPEHEAPDGDPRPDDRHQVQHHLGAGQSDFRMISEYFGCVYFKGNNLSDCR